MRTFFLFGFFVKKNVFEIIASKRCRENNSNEDPDPDPPDPHVFGPPGSGSFYHHAKIVRKTLIPTIL
jgi:hypothetical protein